MSRRRNLSDEEHTLWAGIARSITPLRPAKATPKPIADAGEAAPRPRRPAVRPKTAPQTESPPLAPFERRLKQRVARGRDAIDVRIDLHGMTQRQAHAALLRFLRQAQADGARIALVVTGKGGGNSPEGSGERGVLRRQVPMWLALPEFRHFVVGFDEAHLSHGGQGALYVRLRRVR
jgi:DNA-nicking Smr family endonuclease